jgi:DNA topoisomerase-2
VDGVITKFKTPNDILLAYFEKRLAVYEARRELLHIRYTKLLEKAEKRVRFIMAIIDERIVIFKRSRQSIEQVLVDNLYPKINESFDYLLDMGISSFTAERIEELIKEMKKHKASLAELAEKSAKDLWIDDLNVLIATLGKDIN